MDGEITHGELERLLETDDAPEVVDIRSPPAFKREHIPGSVNIPFNTLPQAVEQLRGANHVVTVCPHGEASVQAAQLIASFEGFDGRVESLERGIAAWDGPLTRGEPEPETDDSPASPL